MADLGAFAARMRQIGANIERNADRTVRRCALAVDGAVVLATPVDTGRARSNWQVSLDKPVTGTIEPYAEGQGGSTGGVNSRSAIEQGKGVIAGYKGGRIEAAICITNNLAYIGRLNDGYSAQAPAAFVEKAAMVGVAAIRGKGSLLSQVLNDEI